MAQRNYNPKISNLEELSRSEKPYYEPMGQEVELCRAAFYLQRPLVLKGPTGCGKTTFSRYMQWALGNELNGKKFTPDYEYNHETGIYEATKNKEQTDVQFPLYLVDGTEDTEVIHIQGGLNHTGKFIGGPMYHWAHTGGILLVNELAEIRSDVQTVFHGALDKERTVTFPDIGKTVELPDHAMMIATYNPGFQAKKMPLKISTKQRLPAINFSYPDRDTEAKIIQNAGKDYKVDKGTAETLARMAEGLRAGDQEESILASREGISTRLFVMAGEFVAYGCDLKTACRAAVIEPLAANDQEASALEALLETYYA